MIYVTHSPIASPCGDWDLDREYQRLRIAEEESASGGIHTATSSMLLITRLRVGVVEDGLELWVRFGFREGQDFVKVSPQGYIDDWTDAHDVNMDLLLRILG